MTVIRREGSLPGIASSGKTSSVSHNEVARLPDRADLHPSLSESIEGVITQTLLPNKSGKGQVAAMEVLVGVPALRNLIRENKTAQILSVIQTGAQHGMMSLDQSLRDLVMQGKLSREVAMKKSSNPAQFETPAPAPGTKAPGRGETGGSRAA